MLAHERVHPRRSRLRRALFCGAPYGFQNVPPMTPAISMLYDWRRSSPVPSASGPSSRIGVRATRASSARYPVGQPESGKDSRRENPVSERRRAPLVTIADLYGTGGSVIGTRVAERLEVPLLDRVIPEEPARRTVVSEDAVADADEEPRSRVTGSSPSSRARRRPPGPRRVPRTTSITRSAACGARSRKPWPRRRGRAAWRSDAMGWSCCGPCRGRCTSISAAPRRTHRAGQRARWHRARRRPGFEPGAVSPHAGLDSCGPRRRCPWTRASS